MEYLEIAKLIRFIQLERVKRKFNRPVDRVSDKPLIQVLREYRMNPVILEIRSNFAKNFHSPLVVDQLKKDYERYIRLFNAFLHVYSEEEQKVLEWKRSQIRTQLRNPTYLVPSSLLDTLEEEGEEKEAMHNPYDTIFTDAIGFDIFQTLHDKYKDENTDNANYSFLFYALKNDGFLVCTGSEWREFLSKNYQIELDRIDARYSGKTNKSNLYEVVKERSTEKAQ